MKRTHDGKSNFSNWSPRERQGKATVDCSVND
jgi:hypothetical protein